MLQASTHRPHRNLVMVVTVLGLATALIGAALWIGLATRPDHKTGPAVVATHSPTSSPSTPTATTSSSTFAASADPEEFAREVAAAIFGWDTRIASGPGEVVEPFMQIADPTGESAAGLVSDLYGYLPTVEAWTELRSYETRQWLTVSKVSVPSLWATALEQGGDELAPGTTAYTVHGTRHRAGVWEDQQVTSAHEVAFTIFMVCTPTYPQCHLLRLSKLDDPLR